MIKNKRLWEPSELYWDCVRITFLYFAMSIKIDINFREKMNPQR